MNPRLALEIIGAALIAVLAWMRFQEPKAGAVNQPQQAAKSPAIAAEAPVPVAPPKTISVYKPAAKAKLNLPPDVSQNAGMAVLDSSNIPESDHSQTVTTVMDMNTGMAKSYVTTDPYPWIAGESNKEIRVAYGFRNGGATVGRLQFAYDLVQIKALHAGLLASYDTNGQAFMGVGLAYRW